MDANIDTSVEQSNETKVSNKWKNKLLSSNKSGTLQDTQSLYDDWAYGMLCLLY